MKVKENPFISPEFFIAQFKFACAHSACSVCVETLLSSVFSKKTLSFSVRGKHTRLEPSVRHRQRAKRHHRTRGGHPLAPKSLRSHVPSLHWGDDFLLVFISLKIPLCDYYLSRVLHARPCFINKKSVWERDSRPMRFRFMIPTNICSTAWTEWWFWGTRSSHHHSAAVTTTYVPFLARIKSGKEHTKNTSHLCPFFLLLIFYLYKNVYNTKPFGGLL